MKSGIVAAMVLLSGLDARGEDKLDRFVGEWKSTMGPVRLERKGDEVSGRLVFWGLPLKGKVEGEGVSVGYDEGEVHVDAKWQLEPSGHAFRGTFRASNGNQGVWNGWRPDPSAATFEGKPGDFSGPWLTDLGLMELLVDGSKVKGRYALRGTSTLEGEAKGRHLDFRVKANRAGPGWFDLDEGGTTLAGAGGTDGMAPWYAWNGRKAPEYARHAPLVAGKIVDGSTENLLTYSVRAPEGYKPGDPRKWPVALVLHGSNMNGKAYVSTIAATWPDVARDYILLGINGELPSNLAADGPRFNFTYAEYTGRSTYRGFPGTDRQSPSLVKEAMDGLKQIYPIRHYFVGGHSQGGYLTYSLLMNFPESVAGAFPISAGLIMQCDPSAFVDDALKKAQRAVPLAIVHGKNDPIVGFDDGSYAHGLFLDAGWPAIRLFADDNAAHRFGLLPVGPAIRWLEALASVDGPTLLDFAEQRLRESAPRDAIAALRRAQGLDLDAPSREKLDRLSKTIDDMAAPQAGAFLDAIRANEDGSWADPFLAFRDEFEFADAAAGVMKAFGALRAEQDPAATEAMNQARGSFNQNRRADGYAKAKEVAARYYASTSYRLAKKWAAENP